MKHIIWISLLLCSWSFGPEAVIIQPPDVFTDHSDASLHQVNGTWIKDGLPYNGYVVEVEGGRKLGLLPIVHGKEHGIAFGWYASGKRKYERRFYQGKREGVHQGWYENDSLAFVQVFHNDLFHGPQNTFFANGKPWQYLNYAKGYEEGKQKSWNESGRLINNFTVKKGKLYGVIGRYDCMSVGAK